MQTKIHRQQELRLRMLNAAYAAFLEDADGFIDAFEINGLNSVPSEESTLEQVDFQTDPASKAELRGAAYYLVERGLLVMMSNDTLTKHQLQAGDVYIHITADGIDAFEGFVLTNESRSAARPMGFQPGPAEPSEARPKRSINPWSKALLEPTEGDDL